MMVADRLPEDTTAAAPRPWRTRSHAERYAVAEALRARYGPLLRRYARRKRLYYAGQPITLRGAGVDYRGLGRAYGVSWHTIWKILHNETLTAPARRMVPLTNAELGRIGRSLAETGSMVGTARALGVPYNRVYAAKRNLLARARRASAGGAEGGV